MVELLALLGDGNFAVSIHDSTESGNVPGGSHESVGVGVGQSAATDSGDTVFHLALVGDDAAAAHDTDAIGSGVPGTNDDLLGAVHLTHQLAEDEGAAVIGQDVDDLAVLQQGDQLTEDGLMGHGHGGHDDDADALHGLSHVVGSQSDLHSTLALIAEVAELCTGQSDAGLLNVGEVGLGEAGLIPQANFLAGQGAVSSHGLAHSAGAQDRDRHILQITHIHCDILLKIIIRKLGSCSNLQLIAATHHLRSLYRMSPPFALLNLSFSLPLIGYSAFFFSGSCYTDFI